MNLSEILLSIVAGAATLTPLILGLLKYFGDKKNPPAEVAATTPPVAILGDSVDFESVAVTGLNRHIKSLEGQVARQLRDLDRKQDELDRAHASLRSAGLPIP